MGHPSYSLTKNGKTHQVAPEWLVVIWRFEDPRIGYKTSGTESIRLHYPLIIRDDAIAVTVTRSKRGYKKSAQVSLLLSAKEYLTEVRPYDYIGIWMANSKYDIDAIESDIAAGLPANGFESGLKFLGKVSSVSEGASVAVNGVPTNTADISAEMFTELDNSIFFTGFADKYILNSSQGLAGSQFMLEKIDKNSLDKIVKSNNRGWSYPNEVIKFFLKVFLGKGPQQILKDGGPIFADNGQEVKATFNSELIVPQQVAGVLGFVNQKPTYVESIYIDTGIEKYGSEKIDSRRKNYGDLAPLLNKGKKTFPFRDSEDLKGYCQITAAPWNNTPLQSIVANYLNDVCNEMFTCMRFDPDGGIRPTIVARQIPFTTKFINQLKNSRQIKTFGSDSKTDITAKLPEIVQTEVNRNNKYTFFSNLPRWVVDKSIVTSSRFGTSDALRVNYVQVISNQFQSGLSAAANLANEASQEYQKTQQFLLGNFVYDENDIKRHGLRALIKETPFDTPFTTTTSTFFSPVWAAMLADWVFNSHLKLTGSLTMAGVQEPICEGDNLEYGDHTFHIESISHQCVIQSDGTKSFTTQLSLSNGMLSKALEESTGADLYGNAFRDQPYAKQPETFRNFGRSSVSQDRKRRGK